MAALPEQAVTDYLTALRAVLGDGDPKQACEFARSLTGSLLEHGLDEHSLRGAALVAREGFVPAVPRSAR